MSIAVSAQVGHSRWLFGLVAGMCACTLVAAGLIAFGAVGDLILIEKVAVAAISTLVALYVFFRTVKSGKMREIHVSGTGRIRLALHDGIPAPANTEGSTNKHGEPVTLLPVSTLWSWLLILHLRHENGRKSVLTILPDAVSEESFRALLVACRWISMHGAEEIRKTS